MLQLLQDNIVSLIILAAIAVLAFFAMRKIVKDKKEGVGPCGQRCDECGKKCEERIPKDN